MRRVNHGTMTSTLSLFKIMPLNGFNPIRAKQRLRRRRKRVCESSSSRRKNKSNAHGQFVGIWKILRRSIMDHRTSTPHRSKTNGIAERAVRRVKEGTSAVLLQSGLDARWWADSVECYCHLRSVQDFLADGKSRCERRFGEPFKGPIIPFGAMIEYCPISARDWSNFINLARKYFQVSFLGMNWSQRWIGKEIFRIWKIWKSWTHQKLILGESTTKKYWSHTKMMNSCSQLRWYIKIVRKRLRYPRTNSQAGTDRQERRFQWRTSRRIGRVSTGGIYRWRWSPCRLPVDSRWLHLSSSQWISSSTLCAKRRNIPYSTEIYGCHKVYSRCSGRHARETCRSWLECGRGFTKFTLCGPGEIEKHSIDYQTRSCMARCIGPKLMKPIRIEKNKNGRTRSPNSTIDPDDQYYQEVIKNAKRKIGKTYGTSHAVQENGSY